MLRVSRMAGLLMVILALAMPAWAAAPPSPLVSLELVPSLAAYPAGQTHPVAFRLKVADGYHINPNRPKDKDLVPTVLSSQPDNSLKLQDITYPKPHMYKLPFLPAPVLVYDGVVLLRARLAVPPTAAAGPQRLRVRLLSQGCNDSTCLMPEETDWDLTVEVAPASQKPKPINPRIFKQ